MERDYRVLRSYRLAFAFDLVFGVVDLLVYYFVSRTFAGQTPANLHGAPSYFAFVAVGIVVTLVVTAASVEAAFRIRDEQLTGTMEVLGAQPLSPVQLAFGLAGFPFAFAAFRGGLYLGFAALLPGVATATRAGSAFSQSPRPLPPHSSGSTSRWPARWSC